MNISIHNQINLLDNGSKNDHYKLVFKIFMLLR